MATTPAAAAKNVLAITLGTSSGSAANVEAPLKPNQPNQSKNTPNAPNGMLCPVITFTRPFSYLPSRGPTITAATNAATAPVKWTTVEPAKSTKPKSVNQP